MNPRIQQQLDRLSAHLPAMSAIVSELEKDRGIVHKADEEEGDILQKGMRFAKGTAANDPPVPSIDGVRDNTAELFAESVSRGNKQVRADMMNDEAFVEGLAYTRTNQPGVWNDLLTLVREEASAHPNHNEGVATGAATVEDFKANLGHPMSGDFGRAKEIMRHAKMLADAYRINSPIGISEGRGFFAVKKSDTPAEDWNIRKADGSNLDPKTVKLGRRMSQSEILR